MMSSSHWLPGGGGESGLYQEEEEEEVEEEEEDDDDDEDDDEEEDDDDEDEALARQEDTTEVAGLEELEREILGAPIANVGAVVDTSAAAASAEGGDGMRADPGPAPRSLFLSQLTSAQKTLILSALITDFPREASTAASKALLVPPPGVRLFADVGVAVGCVVVEEAREEEESPSAANPPRSPPKKKGPPPFQAPAPALAPTAAAAAEGPSKRASWDEMLERLAAYQIAHGDCRIPTKYPLDPPLGRWVDNQRQAYKRYHNPTARGATWLNPERIEALEALGFEWRVATYEFRPWADWAKDMENFRERYGHCRAPTTIEGAAAMAATEAGAGDDAAALLRLGSWCTHQREHFRRFVGGRKSQLTPERIEALDALEFQWQGRPPVTYNFEDRIEQLKKFKEENGHVNVLLKVKDERRSLGAWCADMRSQYNMRLKGGRSSLSDERIAKLTMLGFSFVKNYGPQRSWDVRYGELCKYRERNGHCNVTDEQDKTLALWCRKQREGYRRMKKGVKEEVMTEERANKLDEIGFNFSARSRRGRPPKSVEEANKTEGEEGEADGTDAATVPQKKPKSPKLHRYVRPAPPHWEVKYDELRKFHAEHGHCHVTRKNHSVSIQRWCQRQREQYALWTLGKGSTMSADKIRKLGSLGFNWQARSAGRPSDRESPIEGDAPESPAPDDAKKAKTKAKETQKKASKRKSDTKAGSAPNSKSDTKKRKVRANTKDTPERRAKRAKREKDTETEKEKKKKESVEKSPSKAKGSKVKGFKGPKVGATSKVSDKGKPASDEEHAE